MGWGRRVYGGKRAFEGGEIFDIVERGEWVEDYMLYTTIAWARVLVVFKET